MEHLSNVEVDSVVDFTVPLDDELGAMEPVVVQQTPGPMAGLSEVDPVGGFIVVELSFRVRVIGNSMVYWTSSSGE